MGAGAALKRCKISPRQIQTSLRVLKDKGLKTEQRYYKRNDVSSSVSVVADVRDPSQKPRRVEIRACIII